MAKSTFTLNLRGFRELRKNAAAAADLRRRAEKVAADAGPGFEVRESPSRNRTRFVVVPTTDEARRANRDSYAILRALSAGAD